MRGDRELTCFLAQLEEQALAQMHGSELLLPWQQVYRVKTSQDYAASYPLLKLPPVSTLRPCLASSGSFCDVDFSIYVSGWRDDGGPLVLENLRITGAIIETGGASQRQPLLLENQVWLTLKAITAFHERDAQSRTRESNRNCWARIRQHAVSARAELSNYLNSTVAVAPEKIAIELRKHNVGEDTVVEVIPAFEGQPPNWIQAFDQFSSIRECYEVPDGEALTYVGLSPEMRTVLKEIKRMPGRRVAGDRAKAFLRNPFASLGPDAHKVIDGKHFEEERIRAGISFTRFMANVHNDSVTGTTTVSLRVEQEDGSPSQFVLFTSPGDLEAFIKTVEIGIRKEAQCFMWRGRELEILGDTPEQVATLQHALELWRTPIGSKTQEIFDPTLYSERIAGFGVEKEYSFPFVARVVPDQGWFPQDVGFSMWYTPQASAQPIAIALTGETLRELQNAFQSAKDEARSEFTVSFLPEPLLVAQTETMLNNFPSQGSRGDAMQDLAQNNKIEESTPLRQGLIIKPNFDNLDYEEPCNVPSFDENSRPFLPTKLRKDVSLKDHQLVGIAWLQHLWKHSPGACRGALLADDMGLGKTVQLLAFIAHCLEHNPELDPVLIVAPLSLLENWQDEIEKFFEPHTLPCLPLYGPVLMQRRVPKSEIEKDLAAAGVVRLLIGKWLGEAKVVLTTYETLRDLEFSLARQKWSIMICDEAQKIKTPMAMTARAAKKQNARFKIACTGTPVENTLVDLWCLFDFIQPGLLGSLQEFGTRYTRPIEAATEQEKAQVMELRRKIEPQTLRRTKTEVAKDLPPKISDRACGEIAISEIQRAYYANAITKFKSGKNEDMPKTLQRQLSLLQYLRAVCSDPRPSAPEPATQKPLAELEKDSPKLRWVLTELVRIKARNEKALIFCEIKELQRSLQHSIMERTGFVADIINGDSNAIAQRADSRQRRIRLFQQANGFGVIILSPLALGVGLNIQGANHVIHYTRMWNPAREDQATDRAYRIGQTKPVFVYCPLVVAQDFVTFDAKLHQLLELKRKLSRDILNGSGELGPSDFTDLQNSGGLFVVAGEGSPRSYEPKISPLTTPTTSFALGKQRDGQ